MIASATPNFLRMMTHSETDLLFDDAGALESIRGEDSKMMSSVTANCDCTGYSETYDNEDKDTSQGF